MAFKDIIGHAKQKAFLLSFLERERVPHAFIFTGQDGIGKKKTAIAFAQVILCEKQEACGTCTACRKVERRVHPDLLLIESEGSIGIDHVRGSREKSIRGINQEAYEAPHEGVRRIIIIDNAETMTTEAANALLKTLEEPPLFNMFILVSSSDKDVPLTIKSRCMKVGFQPLTEKDLKDYFVRGTTGNHSLAETLARISCGSIGGGLFWMEGGNFVLRNRIAKILFGGKRSFTEMTLIAEKISATTKGLTFYLYYMLSLLRDVSLMAGSSDTEMIINIDVAECLVASKADGKWITGAIALIEETIRNMRYNVNKWILVENLFIQITEPS